MGGAQRVAYSTYLNAIESGYEATFVASSFGSPIEGTGLMEPLKGRPNEILWDTPPFDYFKMVVRDVTQLEKSLFKLIDERKPDVLHFHHYIRFGINIYKIIKEKYNIPIILTLHEFCGICYALGQMYTPSEELCYESSYRACNRCYPEHSVKKFTSRKSRLFKMFEFVDHFISPSYFLKDRYVQWGLDEKRISVFENILSSTVTKHISKKKIPRKKDSIIKFSFFAQANPNKGLNVLLKSFDYLSNEYLPKIKLTIYGSSSHIDNKYYEEMLHKYTEKYKKYLVHYGAYKNHDVVELMRSNDWLIIPSLWWENSPVVIQEAIVSGVPVLCSDIGGMKEKVQLGIDGLHFKVKNSKDLALKIMNIIDGDVELKLSNSDVYLASNQKVKHKHLELYKNVVKNRSRI